MWALAWHTQLKFLTRERHKIRWQKLNIQTGTSHSLAVVVFPSRSRVVGQIVWTDLVKEVKDMRKGIYKILILIYIGPGWLTVPMAGLYQPTKC